MIKQTIVKFTIPGELPDLNTDIGIIRSHKMAYSDHKEDWTWYVAALAMEDKSLKLQDVDYPLMLLCHWYTPNKKKDCDNITFAKKYILDGLKVAKVITDDSRRFIDGFCGDYFVVDKNNPRVEIFFIPTKLFYKLKLSDLLPNPKVQ